MHVYAYMCMLYRYVACFFRVPFCGLGYRETKQTKRDETRLHKCFSKVRAHPFDLFTCLILAVLGHTQCSTLLTLEGLEGVLCRISLKVYLAREPHAITEMMLTLVEVDLPIFS